MSKHQGVPWHLEERFHSDVFIGNSAVSWIDNYAGDKPIFLMTGFTGPHEPWDPLPRHLDLYAGKEMPPSYKKTGELDEKPPQHKTVQDFHANTHHESQIDLRGASDEEIAEMKRHYFAKITTVDEQVGRVLDALERRGWLDNSLLIFCSDHGEMLGDHGLAYKWLMYDSIVHIPLIIRHPGSVDEPSTVNDLVSLMDLGPTILEAAGVDVPTYLEGRSLLPYLDGESIEPRKFVFCEDNYQIMMRSETPQTRLLHRPGGGRTVRSDRRSARTGQSVGFAGARRAQERVAQTPAGLACRQHLLERRLPAEPRSATTVCAGPVRVRPICMDRRLQRGIGSRRAWGKSADTNAWPRSHRPEGTVLCSDTP